MCKACGKKGRQCAWENPLRIQAYDPSNPGGRKHKIDKHENDTGDGPSDALGVDEVDNREGSRSRFNSPSSRTNRSEAPSASGVSSQSAQDSPASPYFHSFLSSRESLGGSSLLSSQRPPFSQRGSSSELTPLNHHEASLVHHFTENLGRWLDCTDATRQFTLGVPANVRSCPVLLGAVQSFATRHKQDHVAAYDIYSRTLARLRIRIEESASKSPDNRDETLLCALVILHFYEQIGSANH